MIGSDEKLRRMKADYQASVRKSIAETNRAKEEVIFLRSVLDCAFNTLEQIADTPRNAGAKRNAKATLLFLRSQMAAVRSIEFDRDSKIPPVDIQPL